MEATVVDALIEVCEGEAMWLDDYDGSVAEFERRHLAMAGKYQTSIETVEEAMYRKFEVPQKRRELEQLRREL